MTKQELQSQLEKLAPFHHNIELPYGLNTEQYSLRPIDYTRSPSFISHAFPPLLNICGGTLKEQRVLDIGSNCGGFAFEAKKHGADYVLGIDSVDHYVAQAQFIKRVLELTRIDFKTMAADALDPSLTDLFDVTFCCGVLYHFENPVYTMKKLHQ